MKGQPITANMELSCCTMNTVICYVGYGDLYQLQVDILQGVWWWWWWWGDNKTGLHMAIKSQSHNALQYVNDLTFDSDATVCCQ